MKSATAGYHHGDLRNALVEQAAQILEEVGPDDFSLREAARRVGVSPNAAYRHFSDKSDLLTAVAATGFTRLTRRMQRAMAQADGEGAPSSVARFKATGRGYVEFALENPELFRVMFGASGLACLEARPDLETKPSAFEILGGALDDLVSEGLLSPASRPGAELKAWTVVHGFASLVIEGAGALRKKADQRRALESLLDFVVTGVCARS